MRVIILILIILPLLSSAQKIDVSFDKTVHIFYKGQITYKDAGNGLVLLEDKDNILKLVAKEEDFAETNLTLIIKDSINYYYYSFILTYNNNPKNLHYFIDTALAFKKVPITDLSINKQKGEKKESKQLIAITNENEGNSEYDKAISQINEKGGNLGNTARIYAHVIFQVKGIFIKDNKLFFNMETRNNSNIPYEIDFIKFGVQNRRKTKKSSLDEQAKEPLYVSNTNQNIVRSSGGLVSNVFVFDKFTIADDKKLTIELWEKNGDRKIVLDVPGETILKATILK